MEMQWPWRLGKQRPWKREEENVEAETMEKGNVGKKEGEIKETWAVNTKDKEDAVVNSKGKASTN